jgi:hypothetical protein
MSDLCRACSRCCGRRGRQGHARTGVRSGRNEAYGCFFFLPAVNDAKSRDKVHAAGRKSTLASAAPLFRCASKHAAEPGPASQRPSAHRIAEAEVRLRCEACARRPLSFVREQVLHRARTAHLPPRARARSCCRGRENKAASPAPRLRLTAAQKNSDSVTQCRSLARARSCCCFCGPARRLLASISPQV